jgi:hypothetical protein
MQAQADIEAKAAETQARIEAMQAQMGLPVDSGYSEDGGGYPVDDGGGFDAEASADDGSMDSFEDAKYAMDNEDVMGHLRGSAKHQMKRELRRNGRGGSRE